MPTGIAAARVHSSHRRSPAHPSRVRDFADVPGRLPIPRERVRESSTHRQLSPAAARPTDCGITSTRPRSPASDWRSWRIAELRPHVRQRYESCPRRSHATSQTSIHERDETESAPTMGLTKAQATIWQKARSLGNGAQAVGLTNECCVKSLSRVRSRRLERSGRGP